jgi:hypothetical protein
VLVLAYGLEFDIVYGGTVADSACHFFGKRKSVG